MSFAVTPKAKGDEDKAAASLRRLAEEDPTLVLRRDERTGEQLLAGLSQMHVEVAVERLHRRFGVDVDLAQPRVPYLETIRTESRARARYKKQTGGPRAVRRLRDRARAAARSRGLRVRGQDRRRRHPSGVQAGSRQGHPGGDAPRRARRRPVQGVTVRLVDGQYHNVDSSEMAFKIAGSMAFKDAYHKANPMLLEPIMELRSRFPTRQWARSTAISTRGAAGSTAWSRWAA